MLTVYCIILTFYCITLIYHVDTFFITCTSFLWGWWKWTWWWLFVCLLVYKLFISSLLCVYFLHFLTWAACTLAVCVCIYRPVQRALNAARRSAAILLFGRRSSASESFCCCRRLRIHGSVRGRVAASLTLSGIQLSYKSLQKFSEHRSCRRVRTFSI